MEHGEHLAAIDLGSNSFHMVVARQAQGEIQILDGLSEKVQLGAGLDRGWTEKTAWTRIPRSEHWNAWGGLPSV